MRQKIVISICAVLIIIHWVFIIKLDKEIDRTQNSVEKTIKYVDMYQAALDSFSVYKSKYDYAKELYGFEIVFNESDSIRSISKANGTSADSAKILLNTFRDRMSFRDSVWVIER